MQKKIRRALFWLVVSITALMLAGCSILNIPGINGSPSNLIQDDPIGPVGVIGKVEPPANITTTNGDTLTVKFIDVGQGDATLIECGGEYLLIDGGETDMSNKLYAILKRDGIDYIDYIIATHGHSDHCGGISGALTYAKAGTVFCSVTEYDSDAFRNMARLAKEKSTGLTVPTPGQQFSIGAATATVLGPTKEYEETNDTSIVVRIDFGNTSFLFTGDAESPAEKDLVESGAKLEADVLHVGHHGSTTSSSYVFLRAVAPKFAVISCGAGNSYGHPHEETMSKLRDADTTVYRTDRQGDIICTSDGQTLTWRTDKTASSAELNPTAPEKQEGQYIGNINSQVFHKESCANLPSEKNRLFFESREEAIAAGHRPCGSCNP